MLALQGDGHDRARGHEGDQTLEEGPFLVHVVVLAQQLLGEAAHLQADEFEALGFEAGEDLAHQTALYGVRLEEHEGSFHEVVPAAR